MSVATPAPADANLDEQVRIGITELTLRSERCANWANIPFSMGVCWMLWGAVNHAWLLAWLAGKVVLTGLRVLQTQHFAQHGTKNPQLSLFWLEAALLLDGALTGLLGTYLLPREDAVLAVLMVATLMGVAAVALMTLAMHRRTLLIFIVPLLVPAMVFQLTQGTPVAWYIVAGIGFLLFMLVTEGRRVAERTADMLRLRYTSQTMLAQRQDALEQAQRSSAAKGQFLATISHEMRTPLHGILGLARELQRGDTTTERLRDEYLRTIERTGEHLLGIINDVLDYSKLESQHLRLQPQPFELSTLLASVRDLVGVAAADKNLKLEITHNIQAPCWVMGDVVRVRQVLLNLVGNAVKFTDQGAVKVLAHRNAQGQFVVDVVDSGPGVPEADRERVFTAFQQLDGSFARRHGGAGLGLTISRELARAMLGDLLCVAVEDGGVGARFQLSIPLPDVNAPRPVQAATRWPSFAMTEPGVADVADTQSGEPTAPMPYRVLLVEDNEVNAIVATVMLERSGLIVEQASDGETAVAMAAERSYDLILMDCQMPGIDGFEATARIRQAEKKTGLDPVPIVALTANALEGDRERSLASGMDDHLAKPFTEADLLAMVQRYLG